MSYVRPSYNDANASWHGALSYTRPAHNAADATFNLGISYVTGFSSSQFGMAQSFIDYFANASGFSSSQFGLPQRSVNVTEAASSVSTTLFGIASIPLATEGVNSSAFGSVTIVPCAVGFTQTAFGNASLQFSSVGFSTTAFGVAYGESRNRLTSVGITSRFGTHLLLNNDIVADAVHVGPSGFGTPYGYLITHPVRNIVAKAYTVGRSVFGTPSSPVDQSGDADGLRSTQFGTPSLGPMPLSRFGAHRSAQIQPAESLISTQFGDHVGAYGGRVSGLRSTMIGTPTYHRRHEVSGFSKSRFGIPSASQTGVHHVYGFRQTWFGHHKAIENPRHASGFSFSQFGAHDAHETRIVLHIPPTSRFGEHLMTRV